MNITEIQESMLIEHKIVWKKSGNKVVRGVRCTQGPKKGRVVSNGSECSKPIDVKKKFTLRRTRAKMGTRMARKARKTKKVNPISRMVRKLNKS
jgi:hypothetical protein